MFLSTITSEKKLISTLKILRKNATELRKEWKD